MKISTDYACEACKSGSHHPAECWRTCIEKMEELCLTGDWDTARHLYIIRGSLILYVAHSPREAWAFIMGYAQA